MDLTRKSEEVSKKMGISFSSLVQLALEHLLESQEMKENLNQIKSRAK